MRALLLSLPFLIAAVGPARAQVPVTAGLNAGATYYCIVSRCNTGTTVGVSVGVQATPVIALEIAARRHFCFDCGRFTIADLALIAGFPSGTVRPFVGGGVNRTADPEFMGTHTGALGLAGAALMLGPAWTTKLELRGRQVRRGDAMGELSVGLAYRFGGSS